MVYMWYIMMYFCDTHVVYMWWCILECSHCMNEMFHENLSVFIDPWDILCYILDCSSRIHVIIVIDYFFIIISIFMFFILFGFPSFSYISFSLLFPFIFSMYFFPFFFPSFSEYRHPELKIFFSYEGETLFFESKTSHVLNKKYILS